MIFKVLVNGASCHGGDAKWTKGWWKPARNPACCTSGYHLTSDPLRWWMPNAELWLAEWRGALHGDGSDKASFAEARITERITRDWPLLVMFPRLRAFLAASERSNDENADISWANLSRADLSRANLSWANLSGADLSRADLSRANLSWANLSWADLSWANLSWANLSGADLSRADLSGANLSWANLSGADLSRAYCPTDPPPGWVPNAEGRLERAK